MSATPPTKLGFDDGSPQPPFNALDSLRKAASDRFDKRREFEWRITLALWAGMGGFGAFMIGGQIPFRGWPLVTIAAALSLVLSWLHFIYLREITHRNKLDISLAFEYERRMRQLIRCDLKQTEIDEERERVSKQPGKLGVPFFPKFELGITALLALITVATLAWKAIR
jgi:hypothetical protein